jgi:hypothetical protein
MTHWLCILAIIAVLPGTAGAAFAQIRPHRDRLLSDLTHNDI